MNRVVRLLVPIAARAGGRRCERISYAAEVRVNGLCFPEEIEIKYEDRHLSDNEIARLVEGKHGRGTEDWIWLHLRSCGHCFTAYREAAVYRGLWESDNHAFASTEDLVAAGLKVAGEGTSGRARQGARSRPGHIPRLAGSLRYASAALVAAAAVLFMWLLIGDAGGPGQIAVDRSIIAPVKKAVEEVTRRGAFILPGGEEGISAENGKHFRSGYVHLDDSLKRSLGSMFEAYQRGDYSEDLLYWLISGYVAAGQMKTAREIVGHTHKLGVEDSRIAIAEAIISFSFGDNTRSEQLLRKVVRADPGNCAARINLAVVLIEQDKTEEAQKILETVIGACKEKPFGIRARTLVENNRM